MHINISKSKEQKLPLSALVTLAQLVEIYGDTFSVSYGEMSRHLEMSYEGVRKQLRKLACTGLVVMKQSSTRRTSYRVNMDMFNELVEL